MCTRLNTLLKMAQQQTKLTASELVLRPTYKEEFQNIRDNVHKAIQPRDSAQIDEDWDDISHYSKISMKRPKNNSSKHDSVKQQPGPGAESEQRLTADLPNVQEVDEPEQSPRDTKYKHDTLVHKDITIKKFVSEPLKHHLLYHKSAENSPMVITPLLPIKEKEEYQEELK